MGHAVRLFAGPRAALRPFVTLVPAARVFALTPSAALFVLPLTEDVHDALHAAYGTGEWLDFQTGDAAPRLTTTDIAFAANASAASALAWCETNYVDGRGQQIAAAWIAGGLQMKPNLLREGERRPPSLHPINMALRLLGVSAGGPTAAPDEFDAFGLPDYRSNEEILARAMEVNP